VGIQRGRRDRRDVDRESGVSAIEFVMLTPLLFFLIFATVQFALYFFARHVAIAAAQEADRVARAEAAHPGMDWSGDATKSADLWIARLGPNLLIGDCNNGRPCVNPTQSVGNVGQQGWTVSVQVIAKVPSLIPGMSMSVNVTSTGPVEQFIPDTP
jgi:Flp pilus assembly protein TadG